MRIKWRERGRKPGLENDRRGRPREHPKGTSGHAFSRGSPMCGHVISVQKAPLERILRTPKGTTKGSRDHRSLRLTFHNVTSSQKAPLGRILRNFRLRMRTPFHPFWVMWPFRSLPVAMVLVLLYYMVVVQNVPVAHAHAITSGHVNVVTSCHVTSGQGHFR